MFGLVRSLINLFTVGFYYITFRIDKAEQLLMRNPGVIKKTYDEAIRNKRDRVRALTDAISTEMVQEEKKTADLKQVNGDMVRLESVKTGALARAQKRIQALQTKGMSREDIEKDEEVIKCRFAFQDASSTLEEKRSRKQDLEEDLKGKGERIVKAKLELSRRMKEIEKLRDESAETITDVLSAEETKRAHDVINDVTDDATEESLRKMREVRMQAKAGARLAREVSQAKDTRGQEEEFLRYAQETEANDEFANLVGLGHQSSPEQNSPEKNKQEPLVAAKAESRLPE